MVKAAGGTTTATNSGAIAASRSDALDLDSSTWQQPGEAKGNGTVDIST